MFGTEWSSRKLNRTIAGSLVGNYPTPDSLNWDLYLGPAPEVEYHPIYHPFNWRGWTDWGTGAIGDMAAHLIDHPYWALGLTYPTSVEATYSPFGMDAQNKFASYPLASKIVYKFPARGEQPPVTLTWVDGGLMAARPEALPDDVPLDPGGGEHFVRLAGPDAPLPAAGTLSVVGPGTGLGVAHVWRDGAGHYRVQATEGGHLDYAPLI